MIPPLRLARYALAGLSALAVGLVTWRTFAKASQRPAREFTIDEALAQMRDYAARGLVAIVDEGTGSQPRMTIGGTVAGVQHVYLDTSGEATRDRIDNLDPRFGVYLVHLNQMLASMGVDTLLDLGITHGGSNPDDVHNQGRAIDVAGIRGPGKRTILHAAQPIDLNVLRDWGKMPEGDSGTYRLSSNDPGFKEFKAIYDFAVREGADRSCDATLRPEGPPSTIGFASCAITPDHPAASLHAAHQNHMHLQVGRTFGVEP